MTPQYPPAKDRKNALIVFAKQPVKGKVKTRIADEVGAVRALEIYRNLLLRLQRVLEESKDFADLYIYADRHPVFDRGTTSHRHRIQLGNNLGEKMNRAMGEILDSGYEKVVLIGSDCPYLQPETLKDAFASLEETDIVLGPSVDGGYYLIGMKQHCPTLFEDIQWSSPEVFQCTLRKGSEAALSIGILRSMEDIDTFESWERFNHFIHGKEKKE